MCLGLLEGPSISKIGPNFVIEPREPTLKPEHVFELMNFPWEQIFAQGVETTLDLRGQSKF